MTLLSLHITNTHHPPFTHQQLIFTFFTHPSYSQFIPVVLERTHHERSTNHKICFTPASSQRIRTTIELSFTIRTLPTTTFTSSRHRRILRTDTTSLVVFTAPTVSLSVWMLLYTSFHLHAVEEQDSLQGQQQEAIQATSKEKPHSMCITTCRKSGTQQESRV